MPRKKFNEKGKAADFKYRELLKEHGYEAQVYRELQNHYLLSERQVLSEMPYFLDAAAVKEFQYHARLLYSALKKLPLSLFNNNILEIADFFQIPELNNPELHPYLDLNSFSPIGRPDAIITNNGFKFIEQNFFSGIGAYASVDAAGSYFDGHPIVQRLRTEFKLQRFSYFDSFKELIHSKLGKKQSFGILDVEGKPGEEMDCCGVALASALKKRGITVQWSILPKIKALDNQAFFLNSPVNGFLSLYSPKALARRFNEFKELYHCAKKSNTTIFGDLIDLIYWDKQLLGILSDPLLGDFVSPEERESIDLTLPWTRLLRAHVTNFRDGNLKIPEDIIDEKDNFVLKQGSGTLNQATFIGLKHSKHDWHRLINKATNECSWIIQEFVQPVTFEVPYFKSGKLFSYFSSPVCSPYMLDGQLSDFLVLNFGPYDHAMSENSETGTIAENIQTFGPTACMKVL